MNWNKSNITLPISLLLTLISPIAAKGQTANFFSDKSTGCAPLIVSFTNFSTNADSYLWKFGDGLTSTLMHPSHTYYFAGGDFKIELIAYKDSLTDTVTAIINVPADIPYFTTADSACPGEYINFSVKGNTDSENKIKWDFGDGYISEEKYPNHSFNDTGTFEIILKVENQICGIVYDTNFLKISTKIIPPIHIHSNGPVTSICPGENFPYFYDEDKQILWEFGDGEWSTDPYPIHNYDSTGTYNVKITVANGCGNQNSVDTFIVVDANLYPNSDWSYYPNTVCPGDDINFVAKSGFSWSYYWEFENVFITTERYFSYAFQDTGTYNIQLITENACKLRDTVTKTVEISDSSEITGNMQIEFDHACPGTKINFYASTDYDVYWDFGNGDSSLVKNTQYIYGIAGNYPVTLTIKNGCGNTIIFTDTVQIDNTAKPVAFFSVSQSSFCPSDKIIFKSESSGDVTMQIWDFGDGTKDSSQTTYHVYSDTGTYVAKLIVFNLCGNSDTLTRDVVIDFTAPASASFTYSPYDFICPGTAVTFINTSADTSQCKWFFNDGDSSVTANPVHKYKNGGNYLVELNVTNACGNSATVIDLVSITQSSDAFVLISTSADTICINDSVIFLNKGSEPINSYWNFDDGVQTTIDNPIHYFTKSGKHTITLKVETICGEATDSVEVYVTPHDSIQAPALSCIPDSFSIVFSWDSVAGLNKYEVSMDSGKSWQASNNGSHAHTVDGLTKGVFVNLFLKPLWDNNCIYYNPSEINCSTLSDGINENIYLETFKIFPNPAKSQLCIQSLQHFNASQILILDLLSRPVYGYKITKVKNNQYYIDVSNMSKGVFFLKIVSNSDNFIEKVVLIN